MWKKFLPIPIYQPRQLQRSVSGTWRAPCFDGPSQLSIAGGPGARPEETNLLPQSQAPPMNWDSRTLTVSLVWRNHRKQNYERGALAGLGFNSDLPAELLGYDVIGDVES